MNTLTNCQKSANLFQKSFVQWGNLKIVKIKPRLYNEDRLCNTKEHRGETYSTDRVLSLVLLYRLAMVYHGTAQRPYVVFSSGDQLKIEHELITPDVI